MLQNRQNQIADNQIAASRNLDQALVAGRPHLKPVPKHLEQMPEVSTGPSSEPQSISELNPMSETRQMHAESGSLVYGPKYRLYGKRLTSTQVSRSTSGTRSRSVLNQKSRLARRFSQLTQALRPALSALSSTCSGRITGKCESGRKSMSHGRQIARNCSPIGMSRPVMISNGIMQAGNLNQGMASPGLAAWQSWQIPATTWAAFAIQRALRG